MPDIVKILDIKEVTHDVKCFRLERPGGFHFKSGQATDVSINKPGLEDELRPFTFTALDSDPYLEFTIKRYEDDHGVTDQLHQLVPGDQLIIREAWGVIEYKGPGYFIAGGAGITPFISIIRELHFQNQLADNVLFFSNKTSDDIIYEEELTNVLGNHAFFLFTRETRKGFANQRIDQPFFAQHVTDFKKHFYVCGPDPMVKAIADILHAFGAAADSVVFEK